MHDEPLSTPEPRRLGDGCYRVSVNELQVGDRLRYNRCGETVWCPILDIVELSQHRRISIEHFNGESSRLRRRTTLVIRAAREGELS